MTESWKDRQDYRTETFFLQDSAFKIEIDLPTELDSFYAWLDTDDTPCTAQMMYRFSDSRYPIVMESGFFYDAEDYADSSYRFTVRHSKDYSCSYWEKAIDEDIQGLIDRLKEIAEIDSVPLEIYKLENVKIGNIPFQVRKYRTDPTQEQKYLSTLITACAAFDSTGLIFSYECASKDCNGFIERMDKSLNTIRITPNYELLDRKFPRRKE